LAFSKNFSKLEQRKSFPYEKESLIKDFSSVASQSGQLLDQAIKGSFTSENYSWKLKTMNATIMDVSQLKEKILLLSF